MKSIIILISLALLLNVGTIVREWKPITKECEAYILKQPYEDFESTKKYSCVIMDVTTEEVIYSFSHDNYYAVEAIYIKKLKELYNHEEKPLK